MNQHDLDFSAFYQLKPDWDYARQRYVDWWDGKGLAIAVTAPLDEPRWETAEPPRPETPEQRWLDLDLKVKQHERALANTFYGGVAHPTWAISLGPGSLGTMMGCNVEFDHSTVWYQPPMLHDYETHPPLAFERNHWWDVHLASLERGLAESNGRYLVEMPDLIENIDTLAQFRGPEEVLMDLLEYPEDVEQRVLEINQAFFDCFDAFYERIQTPWGGNGFWAFGLWGPGKTAKVQCDFSCMISPEQFRRFVQPGLEEQCDWLDYSMYHLDGTNAIQHIDNLCSIESLNAIEWTPQSGLPNGGDPRWYDLYRQFKAGGKGVQAVGVKPEEVMPLIDAVGPEGLFIVTGTRTETEARELLAKVGWES